MGYSIINQKSISYSCLKNISISEKIPQKAVVESNAEKADGLNESESSSLDD
jgi:hypothetical protein